MIRTVSSAGFICSLAFWGSSVCAQDIITLPELQTKSPTQLSRDDLLSLIPASQMSRTNEKGSTHRWSNEPSGDMIVSSDNSGTSRRASTAQGKWNVAENGRYCITVEWKRGESEDTCRFIFKTTDGYYAVTSLESQRRNVYRLTITR